MKHSQSTSVYCLYKAYSTSLDRAIFNHCTTSAVRVTQAEDPSTHSTGTKNISVLWSLYEMTIWVWGLGFGPSMAKNGKTVHFLQYGTVTY